MLKGLYNSGRPVAARLYRIPLLGYALRTGVAFAKLPRFNKKIRELEARLASPAEESQPAMARLADLEASWHDNIPAFLNAVSSVQAIALQQHDLRADLEGVRHDADVAQKQIGEHAASISRLWERLEFVRREILFEVAYNPARASMPATPKTAIKARENERVAVARASGRIVLNLGCGHIAAADCINVDRRDLPNVDLVAEVEELPFEAGTVQKICSAHLLEHFPQEELARRLLPYWRSLLQPGGVFEATAPDMAAMLKAAASGEMSFEDFREVLFGAQDYIGDYHYNAFSPESLLHLLQAAGFVDITIPVEGRRNGKCFEFTVIARVPG